VVSNVASSSGTQASLFERDQPIGYARFVPSAAVPSSQAQVIDTVLDTAFAIDRVVLLDSMAGLSKGVIPNPLPAASGLTVTVEDWKPGEMRVRLGSGPPSAGYVLIAENWDAEWRATVDGRDTPVLRGDGTLITVPVPAGARDVAVRYAGRAYARGRLVTIVSLLIVALGLAVPVARRSRARSPGHG
jgi:hypothetical protein